MKFLKKIKTEEYLELKKAYESLRIELEGLRMDFELIVAKLKLKYKISSRNKEEKEEEDLKDKVLLPE